MSAEPLPTAPVPGEHYWLSREQMLEHWPSLAKRDWVSCLWCGKVKLGDGSNPPCNGVVTMSLRREPLIVEVPTVLSRIEKHLAPKPPRARAKGARRG